MKPGAQIKVHFSVRGELNLESFSHSLLEDLAMSAESSPECMGIAEIPWAEFIEMTEDDKIIAKLLNSPMYQLVKHEGRLIKLKRGDVCIFKWRIDGLGYNIREFVSLHRLGEQ